ncbi:MAG: hypothetical protein A2091_11300 [Desulfuromonadales bacterium GWD2_61_12]|nr:MAG: hypothetical protein A2005_09370 [Desulfuromonadales bacterium GWC2_61_20]OGR36770.1 MAG: hypothetical protein A2091_11300 [Desulfuromonadales bacterium GWD2_61_12]HAD04154.1 sensor histidine kinase [Desulfuromonas sp.]HBT82878.1 sensor histidine kinase [Desulfuromonas sp.]
MSLIPRPFIGLRLRFMAVAVLLTLGTTAVWGIWTWRREQALYSQTLAREGEMLVSIMAIPIINALLYEELGIIREGGLLDNFVGDIMANSQLHPLYAIVLDQNGRVLAHNRFSEFGTIYNDPLTRAALAADGFTQRLLLQDGQRISDLAMPLAIAGKRWGCLRVGVSLEPMFRELDRLAWQILFFAGVFSFCALGVFFLIGNRLSHPLAHLAREMESVGDKGGECRPKKFRQDEIGQLQRSFCAMLERLRKSEEERQSSLLRMLENERLATVGKIASGVAHEVNNPLAGIQGALYFIDQKGGEEVGRYTGVVQQGIERIRRIVGQLLDLSRPATMDLETVDSRVFFEDLTLFASLALKARKVHLRAEDRTPPMVLCLDRDKIHQVILNLALNAADAVSMGGTVQMYAEVEAGRYRVVVHDDGPGIAPEIREQIFEPFFTTKAAGSGSGMGLAISRGIAESHGGTLTVESTPGDGCSFILSLNCQAERESYGI